MLVFAIAGILSRDSTPVSALLLVAAGFLAPAHDMVNPYQGNGAAMAEPESRIATNPALVGSDPSDQGLHARFSLDAGLPWNSDQAHSAVYDTERTAQLFCAVLNRWRQFSENDLAAAHED